MKSQQEAIAAYMPVIEGAGRVYEKFAEVYARPAVVGEVIVTVTSDGKETQNTAGEGDMVVMNLTKAREEYILPAKKFQARYVPLTAAPNGWTRYRATGECIAVMYHGQDTEFMAAWNEPMRLRTGDMLCTPLPQRGEVYRIAAKEFQETYRPKTS